MRGFRGKLPSGFRQVQKNLHARFQRLGSRNCWKRATETGRVIFGRIIAAMTRARIRTSGLGNSPLLHRWMDAALCAFVSLVAKLFQFRRKDIPAQRRHQEALRHPLRLVALMVSRPAGPCRTTRRSTSPSRFATEGGNTPAPLASLDRHAIGGVRSGPRSGRIGPVDQSERRTPEAIAKASARRLRRVTEGVVSATGLLRTRQRHTTRSPIA